MAKKEKPNKIKIDMAFENCMDSIQNSLDEYELQKQGYINKIIFCKQRQDADGEEFNKQRLIEVLSRRKEMSNLYAQVDSFKMEINELFQKMEIAQTIGLVTGEVSKIFVDKNMKALVKKLDAFPKKYQKIMVQFDGILGKVNKSMTKVDSVNNKKFEASINNAVKKEMELLEATVLNVKPLSEELDAQKGTL